MTVTALPVRDEYTGTAGQTVFNYTFLIFTNLDLNVYITPAGQEANDATDITTAYTVDVGTIGNPVGGFITLSVGVSAGDLVTIVSSIVENRTTDYQNSGDFLPDTVNSDFDRVVSLVKQIDDKSGRTLAFPESLQNATALTLPNPDAGFFLKWKNDLSGLENTGAPGIVINGTNVGIVSSMVADTLLIVGDYVFTNGYTTAGDGGDNSYEIVAGGMGTADGGSYIDLANGLQAKGLFPGDIINVKQFGAVGDGVTDDTVAIQATLDSIVNGRIHFSKGTYVVSSAINVATNDTEIVGEGMLATTIETNSITDDVFFISAGGSAISRVVFRNIGVSASVTKTAGAGFHFERASGGGVYSSYISKQFRGIRVTGSPNSNLLVFKDLLITEVVVTTGIGASIESGNDHYMQNILVSSTAGSECLSGYEVSDNGAVWMDNCGALFCGDGLRVIVGASQTVSWSFFNRCAFDSGTGDGIRIVSNSATATIKGMTFTDCWTASFDGDGVSITGVASSTLDGIYFNNHRSYNNGERGIYCAYGRNIHLNNCEITGNSQASSGVYHGIEFDADISEFSILDTMSGQQAGFGITQAYGIVIQAGSGDNYRIQGCDLRNNATGGILNLSTGVNNQVFGNLPFENANSINIGAGASITRHLSATTTWDPPSLADGAAAGTAITVTGAGLGDTVVPALSSLTNADWQISGFVVAADTCRVTIVNHTGGVVDLPSGTLRADVWKH